MRTEMDVSIEKLKEQMCEVGRRIWRRGYCAGNEGNHSVRIGQDRVLCTPTGISKGFLEPDDICIINLEGQQIELNQNQQRPTSEVLVHLAIYKHRPDVRAVIHSHPPHATAFAVADVALPQGIHPEAEIFLGKVPTAKFAMPSTQALPDSIIPLIGDQTNTVLLGNHGSVSFSTDLIDAYYRLEILDNYCRILILCQQLGKTNVLDVAQVTELLEVKKKFGFEDDRLICAPQGCVTADNQDFLATFDVRPTTATCQCNGGHTITHQAPPPATNQTRPTDVTDNALTPIVQAITDQIMAKIG